MNESQPKSPADALVQALNHLQDRSLDAALVENSTGHKDQETSSYFGFIMGGQHCLIQAGILCELIVEPDLASIPNAPELLLGLYNNRGTLVPVFQLHSMLRVNAPIAKRVLLLDRGRDSIGLLIDNLPSSLELDNKWRTDDPIPESLRGLCEGSYFHSGTHWYRLDSSRLGERLLALSQGVEEIQVANSKTAVQ